MSFTKFYIGINYQEFVSEENQLTCSLSWNLPSNNPACTMFCSSITVETQAAEGAMRNLEQRLNDLFALIPPDEIVKLNRF